MSWSEVRHQDHARKVIRHAVLRRRVPHAYLFHGPDGVGKETLARAFGRFLLCCGRPNDGGVPEELEGCGRCEDCVGVDHGVHPDLNIVHRYLNREHPDADVRNRKGLEIGVDVMRHFLIDRTALTPIRGRAKVFIVREADRITPQAQNALLKTLEEPHGATFIILLSAAVDTLLPTTLSRCRPVRFDALPAEFIAAQLAERFASLTDRQVQWYARAAEGSLGRAIQDAEDQLFELNQRLLESMAPVDGVAPTSSRSQSVAPVSNRCDVAEWVRVWNQEADALAERYRKRDPDITDTEATRRGLATLLRLTANAYADLARRAAGDDTPPLNADWESWFAAASAALGPEQAAETVQRIARAERQLDLNVNPQLCIECLLQDLVLQQT